MTLDQLVAFIAVAEREHVTRAAAFLNITPSAVSAAIKSLERCYDVRLFDRVGRQIRLSAEGRIFLVEAKAIVARASDARTVLAELSEVRCGSLSLVASNTIANYWLPPRLMEFRHRFPDVVLNLNIVNTEAAVDAVLEGTVDAGFVLQDVGHPSIASETVDSDQMVLAVDPGNPVLQGGDASILGLVRGLGWILREPGSGVRAAFEAELRSRGLDPAQLRVEIELPSNEAVLSAIVGTPHAAVVSALTARELAASGRIAILHADLPQRRFILVRHSGRHFSRAAQAFRDLCAPMSA